jgi:hypothetical protein
VKVCELISSLTGLDPDAVVLYLDEYADTTDAVEINEILAPNERWTCERHVLLDGRFVEVHHPTEGGLSVGWNPSGDQLREENVVVLSSRRTRDES